MKIELRGMKKEHDKLIEVIAAIENDNNPPEFIRVCQLVTITSRNP